MPHTSHRRKAKRAKRTGYVDENGWTRVATVNNSERMARPLPAQKALERRYADMDRTCTIVYPELKLPANSTVEVVEEKYRKHERTWLESDSCKQLERYLRAEVDAKVLASVDKCFVFGTGSFSGLLRGWIDRSHVAMYQLAAFLSVVNTIDTITGQRPHAYSQEPIYNDLDMQFLSRLGIETIKTPSGFKQITPESFVYSPNAELDVTLRTLVQNPAIAMVTSKLDLFWRNDRGEACTNMIYANVQSDFDDDEDAQDGDGDFTDPDKFKPLHKMTKQERERCDDVDELENRIKEGLAICEGFREDKEVRSLPVFDVKDQPFYDVHLFYRKPPDEMNGADQIATHHV